MKPSELLAKPENWTKGSFAKDKHERLVHPTSQDATCYCLIGALVKCNSLDEVEQVWEHPDMLKIKSKLNTSSPSVVWNWNDAPERTHQEVLDLLKSLDL